MPKQSSETEFPFRTPNVIDVPYSDLRKSKPEEKENALTQNKKRKEKTKTEEAETEAPPKSKGQKKK